MFSVFIDSITDAVEEKPSVIIIYLIIGFFAFGGLISILNTSKVDVSKYATIDVCSKSFKIENYINDDGSISENLSEEIFDACSTDGDMKEVITEQIIDDLREDIEEEVKEDSK